MSEISVDKPDRTDALGIDNPVRVPDEFRLPEVASMRGLAPGARWSLSIHDG